MSERPQAGRLKESPARTHRYSLRRYSEAPQCSSTVSQSRSIIRSAAPWSPLVGLSAILTTLLIRRRMKVRMDKAESSSFEPREGHRADRRSMRNVVRVSRHHQPDADRHHSGSERQLSEEASTRLDRALAEPVDINDPGVRKLAALFAQETTEICVIDRRGA